MRARRINKLFDYSTVMGWWKAQGFPVIPQSSLPQTGFIVENLASGWLYKTDSDFAWLEWIVANPESDTIERREAIDLIIKTALDEASKDGKKIVFSTLEHPRLKEAYKENGFIETDTGMSSFIRSL